MAQQFDLVVIGGGPAGIAGANTASIFGKRVALVEKLCEVGGAGINTGTIPSKTLRETALALSGVRSRKLFGVDLSLQREATVADFMRHEKNVAMMSGSGAALFNRICFNYPTLGDLYKYATYEAILKRDGVVPDEKDRTVIRDE